MNGMWTALAGQVTSPPKPAIVLSTRTPATKWEVAATWHGVFVSVGKNMAVFHPIPNLNIDEVCP